MGFTPFRRPHPDALAALDIGTTKVACLIARPDEDGRPRIAGAAWCASRGVRSGLIVDLESCAAAIADAVSQAEQQAGIQVHAVAATLPGAHCAWHPVTIEVDLDGHQITPADLARALAQARIAETGETELLQTVPVATRVDGVKVEDPIGMVGDVLAVEMNAVTAGATALRNLRNCVGRCHLDVETVVVSAYAASLGALLDDERALGCTVVDIGGGTTDIAVVLDGALVFVDQAAIGGGHVTNDIARGLSTSVQAAERLKTLHGGVFGPLSEERGLIEVPPLGDDDPGAGTQIPRALLTGIIQPRLEEIFEIVRARLDAGGLARAAGRHVVLTGGAALLPGTRELASQVLDKQVRIGRAASLPGLPEAMAGPAFAGVAGLLVHAADPDGRARDRLTARRGGGVLARIQDWIRENW